MMNNAVGNASMLEHSTEVVSQSVRIADTASREMEMLEREEAANARSTRIGIAYGFAAGILIGLAQLAIIGNGVWSMWGAAMLPIYSGIGWALIGAIVGCGGILAKREPERGGK